MFPTFQRTIAADVPSLHQLQSELVRFLDLYGVSSRASHDAQIVCEELIVNAIRHALGSHRGADHRIELTVTLRDSIAIQIRDDLPLFDPTSVPSSRPASSLAAAPAGGRGLAMVRRATTRFCWRADDGWNVVDAVVAFGPA